MSQPPALLEAMRRNAAGHRRRDILRVLLYYGFVFSREARHGSIYAHPDLMRHPDLEVRMSKAWVLIPKGRVMPEYVAREVVAAVKFLTDWKEEETDAAN